MASRREFTRNQCEAIVDRSRNERGEICCERCHIVLAGKPHEIDHTIPEALRPEADKKKPLTIADGQLLCLDCHRGPDGKTNDDVKRIAKGKRQNAAHIGIKTRPVQKIPSAPFAKSERTAKNQARERVPLPPRRMFEPREGA